MFTGLISSIGTITAKNKDATKFRIASDYQSESIDIGASIACDGICLTVISLGDKPQDWFEVEVSIETLSKTNLSHWTKGCKINLERALKVGDELGGHIVSGHVDGLAKITEIYEDGDSTRINLCVPEELSPYIVSKGSVTLNGTSLTINDVNKNVFNINLIPHTKAQTTWKNAKIGDPVNLEVDMLARYLARFVERQQSL